MERRGHGGTHRGPAPMSWGLATVVALALANDLGSRFGGERKLELPLELRQATGVSVLPRNDSRGRFTVDRAPFGVTPDGERVEVFTLRHASGVEVRAI